MRWDSDAALEWGVGIGGRLHRRRPRRQHVDRRRADRLAAERSLPRVDRHGVLRQQRLAAAPVRAAHGDVRRDAVGTEAHGRVLHQREAAIPHVAAVGRHQGRRRSGVSGAVEAGRSRARAGSGRARQLFDVQPDLSGALSVGGRAVVGAVRGADDPGEPDARARRLDVRRSVQRCVRRVRCTTRW